MALFYSKRGEQVFGPYESFRGAKEAAGVEPGQRYESRQRAGNTFIYIFRDLDQKVLVGERVAMLNAGHLTYETARMSISESIAEQKLQEALADLEVAQQTVRDLQARNDELARRLRAVRSVVESLT